MLATIWTCTHEWSLISSRTTAFTLETCHQAFSSLSSFARSSARRRARLPSHREPDLHAGDRLGRA